MATPRTRDIQAYDAPGLRVEPRGMLESVPARERPGRRGDGVRAVARSIVALLDRLNGSKPLAQVHDADYQHLMRVTDT